MKNMLLFLLTTLLLTACGGGGDGGNSSVNNPSEDDTGNSEAGQTISIETPESGAQVNELVGGQYESSVEKGITSTPFTIPETPTFMMALSENEELIWLGITNPQDESLALGADSTAIALLALHPLISITLGQFPEETRKIITDLPEVRAFANTVASTGDWAEMADQSLQDAYSAALVAAATAIIDAMDDSTLALQDRETPGLGGSANDGKRVSIPGFDVEALVSVPENSDKVRSGVRLDISGTHHPVDAPETELSVTNLQRRWVSVVISRNEDGSSYVDSFNMSATSSLIPWEDASTTISRTYELSFIEDPAPLYVSVLGPSLDGFPAGLSPVQRNQALAAAAATLTTELILPALSPMVGDIRNTECLKELVTPIITSPITFLAEQPQLRDQLQASQYVRAAVAGMKTILSGASESATSCLAEKVISKYARKWIPFLGQMEVLVDTVPALAQVVDAVWSTSESRWHEQWVFNNETLTVVDVTSNSALRPPLATYGAAGYATSDRVSDRKRADWPGTCDEGEEDVQCLGFTFDSDPPWSLDFAILCRHPATDEPLPCREALFSELKSADADGIVRQTIEFDSAGEWKGDIEAWDIYGATKSQTLHIQVQRAEPQLRFRSNEILTSSFGDNVLTVEEPLELICCEENQNTVSRTIYLDNTMGNAEAQIISMPTVDMPGFDVSMPSSMVIPPGQSRTIEISYDPMLVSNDVHTANLSLYGVLGGEVVSNDPGLGETRDYTTMVLSLEGKSDCGQGEMIAGRYQVRGNLCEIVYDTGTGLEWQRSSRVRDPAGDGWRFPTKDELRTLVYCSNTGEYDSNGTDSSCGYRYNETHRNPETGELNPYDDSYDSPTINQTAFPGTGSGWYLTSTYPLPGNLDTVSIVTFENGRSFGSTWGGVHPFLVR